MAHEQKDSGLMSDQEREKGELERAGMGHAFPKGEGVGSSGWFSCNDVFRADSSNHGSDGKPLVVQDLIRNSEPGTERDQFVILRVQLLVHGKEVHVWKTVLRFMRLVRMSGISMNVFVSEIPLADIKEEGDSDG